MSLSQEKRLQLADRALKNLDFALRLHKHGALVEEVMHDKRVLTRLRDDAVFFCAFLLGFKPTNYQEKLLQCEAKRILLRWARQSGKTWILAARTVWYSAFHRNTLTLIVAPGLRQSMILSDKIHELLAKIPREIRRLFVEQQLRTVIRFRNKSQIVALPNSENLLRGYTAHQIITDESAFFRNDEEIFLNVLTPMLATTDGTLIVSSTPWGKNTLFYKFNQDPDFEKIVVTWKDALQEGRYKPSFVRELEKMRNTQPQRFKMEYEAQFIEDVDTWLSQDLLAKTCLEDLDYLDFDRHAEGEFYLGADFGKHRDFSVVAVVERKDQLLMLRYCHRFPLETSYATVIGHMKVLGDRWKSVRSSYLDQTGLGDYIVEDSKNAGVPNVDGVTFTEPRKEEMATALKQAMLEGKFWIPYDRKLIDELNVEKYEFTKTGKIRFSHPEGTHDDRFWAVTLAVYAATVARKPVSRPKLISF